MHVGELTTRKTLSTGIVLVCDAVSSPPPAIGGNVGGIPRVHVYEGYRPDSDEVFTIELCDWLTRRLSDLRVDLANESSEVDSIYVLLPCDPFMAFNLYNLLKRRIDDEAYDFSQPSGEEMEDGRKTMSLRFLVFNDGMFYFVGLAQLMMQLADADSQFREALEEIYSERQLQEIADSMPLGVGAATEPPGDSTSGT